MPSIRSTATSLLALLVASSLSACNGDDETSVDAPLDADAIENLQTLADRLVAAGVPGVSVAVQDGDQTVLLTSGVEDRATGAPLSPDHRFRVASIAKSVVASVLLQLVNEGRIELDDTLEDWLPGIVPANAHVSIENLLRLQSGLFDFASDERLMAPYYQGDFGYSWAPRELVAMAAEHPPLFEPGAEFSYANTNYVLLGMIIEKITGDTLANVVQQRITTPLGMSSSTMATGSELTPPYAHGYMIGLGDEPMDVTGISASAVFGNGNLVSTALDVTRFFAGLANGQVVSEGQLPAMFATDPDVADTHYAMGVFRMDTWLPCGTFIGHDGAVAGYDSTGYSSLDGGRQFAVLTSALTPDEKVGDERAQQAFMDLILAAACD